MLGRCVTSSASRWLRSNTSCNLFRRPLWSMLGSLAGQANRTLLLPSQKQNRRVPDRFFRKPTAVFTANLSLGLDDPRSYEENQPLVRGADASVFEQVAQPRD